MRYIQFISEIYAPPSFRQGVKYSSEWHDLIKQEFKKKKIRVTSRNDLDASGGSLYSVTFVEFEGKHLTAIKVAQSIVDTYSDARLCLMKKGSPDIVWSNY